MTVPSSLVQDLWEAQRGLCFHCNQPMRGPPRRGRDNHPRRWSRDHLLPKSRGGTGRSVVVLACRECNSRRGNPEPTIGEIVRAEAIYRSAGRVFRATTSIGAPARGWNTPLADLADRLAGAGA